jgi:hypothetical protein
MRRIVLPLTLLVFAACAEELSPPRIEIDISPVNLGIHQIDPDAEHYHFDLQLINKGEQKLIIESVTYRGDQNCSFTFEGPDKMEMGKNESSFIRGWYVPTIEGEDQIEMLVVSNSDKYDNLIVPICGKAVPLGTEDPGALPVCVLPPADQPDCEAP